MSILKRTALLCLVGASSLLLPSFAATSTCPVDRPIRFAEASWASAILQQQLIKTIAGANGCQTEGVIGQSKSLVTDLMLGRIDISGEWWIENLRAETEKAFVDGSLVFLGPRTGLAVQGTWVPRYVIEKYPDLKTFADLKKYKEAFKDPEDPTRGRYYAGATGWYSTIVNTNQARAYLGDSFNSFEVGDGAMLKAAVKKAVMRKQPIVLGWWSPDGMIAEFDLVQLKEPPHDPDTFPCLTKTDCPNPVGSGWKPTAIQFAASSKFFNRYPALAQQFAATKIPLDVVNQTLRFYNDSDGDAEATIKHFYKTYPAVWKAWNVPSYVKEYIEKTYLS